MPAKRRSIRRALCALLLTSTVTASAGARDDTVDKTASALPWLKIDALSATRDRPLFAPDRRKAAPIPAPPDNIMSTQEVPPKPQLALVGIIVEPTATFILLHDLASSETITLRSGQSFDRWRLIADTDHSVSLRDGDKRLELDMFTER